MGWRQRYERRRRVLCTSAEFCAANRRLFAKFLQWEERKLRRVNGLRCLDDPCFKTLYGYTVRLANVSRWFANRPWADLTVEDIRSVHDALEDGRILNRHGRPFEDLRGYYSKIFKAKPFQLANKVELARTAIEYTHQRTKEVRFAPEESFRKLASAAGSPIRELLLWLAWDVGENIGTLLQLTTSDVHARATAPSGEREYLIHLPRTKLKRCRVSRGEPTLYARTVELLDLILKERRPGDRLFPCCYRSALHMISRLARTTHATTLPDHQPVRWKDRRSGMACHLLACGWTSDEVNARLGHAPNSAGLNCYINFLALGRDEPKRRMRDRAGERRGDEAHAGSGGRPPGRSVIRCPHCEGILAGWGT